MYATKSNININIFLFWSKVVFNFKKSYIEYTKNAVESKFSLNVNAINSLWVNTFWHVSTFNHFFLFKEQQARAVFNIACMINV